MIAGCPDCRRRHLWTGAAPDRCPACGGGPLHEDPEAPVPEAELAGIADVDPRKLQALLQTWAAETPCCPAALDAAELTRAATRAWWPVWLVDIEVRGSWSAQAGVVEEVESAVEELRNGRWSTTRVRRPELRHVPRLGTVDRRYENLVVAAVDAPTPVLSTPRIGAFTPDGAPWLLPDVDGEARDAPLELAVRAALREDLARAMDCHDVRDLDLQRQPAEPNWTFLLVPVWLSSWKDEAGAVQPVLVNAVTGAIAGRRQGSPRQARRRLAQGLGFAALALLAAVVLGGAGLLVPLVLPLALLALFVAIVPAAWGVREVQKVAAFNRAEQARWSPSRRP